MKHVDDDLLAACLDGEVSDRECRKIDRHLDECWSCRARSVQLAETIVELATVANSEPSLTDEQLQAARLRFSASSRTILVDRRGKAWFLPWHAIAGGLAVFALCAVILLRSPGNEPSPAALLTSVSSTEQRFTSLPAVHQVFRVEITDGSGKLLSTHKQLSVWSDGETGQFASRLERAAGVLDHAVWVPDRKHAYRYDFEGAVDSPRSAGTIAGLADQVAKCGPGVGGVEAALAQWLRSRPWKPVSLSSEMASFVSADGAVLSAERVVIAGAPALRLKARKHGGSGTLEMILQVDPGKLRVRALSLRLETVERRIELSVAYEDERLETASFSNTVFEPDRKLLKFVVPIQGEPFVARSAKLATTKSIGWPPAAREIFAEEIQLYFALHRIGACAGEQIEITRTPTGLNVMGIAESASRKSEWLAALNASHLPGWVHLDLQTPEDVLKQTPDKNASPLVQAVTPVSVQLFDSSHYLMEGAVEQYLKTETEKQTAVHFADSSLRRTERILAEAAALNQLASVGSSAEAGLPTSSERLVRTMVSDHLAAIRRLTTGLREQVIPALSSFARPAGASTKQGLNRLDELSSWTSVAPIITSDAQRLYRDMALLFGPKPAEATSLLEEPAQTLAHKEVIDFFETLKGVEDGTRIAAQNLGSFSSTRN